MMTDLAARRGDNLGDILLLCEDVRIILGGIDDEAEPSQESPTFGVVTRAAAAGGMLEPIILQALQQRMDEVQWILVRLGKRLATLKDTTEDEEPAFLPLLNDCWGHLMAIFPCFSELLQTAFDRSATYEALFKVGCAVL